MVCCIRRSGAGWPHLHYRPIRGPRGRAAKIGYDRAIEDPDLYTKFGPRGAAPVNRFLPVPTRPDHRVKKKRRRILRLIEKMTFGSNAAGCLAESMQGDGSPQARRIRIRRGMKPGEKKSYARRQVGIWQAAPSKLRFAARASA